MPVRERICLQKDRKAISDLMCLWSGCSYWCVRSHITIQWYATPFFVAKDVPWQLSVAQRL